jgi:periodic tryptophan protein 1
MVLYYDARKGSDSAPVFTLAAHSDPVSALDISPYIPGLMLTGSSDKTLKVWDILSGSPSMVCSRDVEAGKIFAASFCKDSPYLVAVGGSKGVLSVWNITENAGARRVFEGRQGRVGQVTMSGPGALATATESDGDVVDEAMSEVDSDIEELTETLHEMGRQGDE